MRLRPYDPARDLERCMAIWRAASEVGHPFLDAATLDTDARVVRDEYMPQAEITVAEDGGEPSGFIALLGAFVGGLFVDPSRHRSGTGRALIRDAARRRGALEVEVYEANPAARAFYAACGFAVIGRREADDQGRPLPLVRMRLEPCMTTSLDVLREGRWLNAPAAWRLDRDGLEIETGSETDFWRDTLYGFRRDSGHALLVPVAGDFTAFASFGGDYRVLYDQAGLMLRRDESLWLKTGVEFSDGAPNMSTVVTRGASDWSTIALPGSAGPQRLRLTRLGGAVVVQFRNAARRWQLMRVADFPAAAPLEIGPMACSPQRGGFRARFTEFRIEPPVVQPLHDESAAD